MKTLRYVVVAGFGLLVAGCGSITASGHEEAGGDPQVITSRSATPAAPTTENATTDSIGGGGERGSGGFGSGH